MAFGKPQHIQRIKSSHISNRKGKMQVNNLMGGPTPYLNLQTAEFKDFNHIKTRSSINDQKSSHLNRTRDKTPKIDYTSISVKIPNNP